MSIIIIIILAISIIGIGILEGYLSTRTNKFYGLIIPAVFFILMSVFLFVNMGEAFYSVKGFGQFLSSYGQTGLFALVLKTGFAYLPVIFYLAIYFICRGIYKHNHPSDNKKEMDKRLAEDL